MAKKKKSVKMNDAMAERVATLESNPVFHEMPRKDKKVTLDPRFNKMFKDAKFASTSAKIDRRGRPVGKTEQEELKAVYDIESDLEGDEEQPKTETTSKVDFARGEGVLESSSEEESSEEEDEEETGVSSHDRWGELDSGARRVDWTSRRIAVCNMDWDKIKAEDLFMALESFKPASGKLQSVVIYLSDFGAERLEEEDKSGPKLDVEAGEYDNDKVSPEVIRSYQLDRFKYYYAVVTCDVEQTATAIYEACDGMEYESSGTRFDLRFILDDMDFEESRIKGKCLAEDFNSQKYQPKYFESAAVNKTNVKMDWDTNDYDRQKKVQRAFEPNADLDQFAGLIASGSDDDDEDFLKNQNALLSAAGIVKGQKEEEGEDESESEEEKEAPATETPESAKKKKSTPFQEFLERRKQKRKERKQKIKEQKQTQKRQRDETESKTVSKPVAKKTKLSESAAKLSANTEDSRFSALFTNSEFAIDRTNPQFKGGVLADKQIQEKIKRKRKG